MNWSAIVSLLIKLIVWLINNKLDDQQRQKVANEIDEASRSWTDAYVDERLQPYYRDDPESTIRKGDGK